MAVEEKVVIDIEAKINAAESIKDLKELIKLQKGVAAGSADYAKLEAGIDALKDTIKGAKDGATDWVDTLEGAGGPLGALGGAINKAKVATQSFGAAFKAIGIGLIVSAVAGLVGAFTQTEGSMKKLEPLFVAFEKILGGIFEAIQPLLDSFIELATKALPTITDGIKIFYGLLVGLFTLLKESGTGAGKILKGIFTLDTDSITEGYDQIKDSLTKTVDAFNKSQTDFDKGYAKQTKSQKKSAEDQAAIDAKRLAEKIKHLEAQDKLDASVIAQEKAKELALQTTEQGKLDTEKKFYELSYNARVKDLQDKQALYQKGTDEYIGIQTELNQADAERTLAMTAFGEKQKEITKNAQKALFDDAIKGIELKKAQGLLKEEEYQKSIYDLAVKYGQDAEGALIKYEAFKTEAKKKSAEDARVIALSEIQDEIDKLKAINDLIDGDYLEDQLRLEKIKSNLQKQKALELSNVELTNKEKNEIIKRYAKEEQEIEKELTVSKKNELEARKAAQIGFAQAVGNVIGQLGQLFEQGTQAAKIAALAEIAIGTGIGFIQGLDIAQKSAKATGPAAAFAFPIFYATQIAAVLAAASKAKAILSSAKSGGGSSSGPAATPQPQINFQGTSIPTPEAQTGSNVNPTSQIAQSLAQASGKPIQAYVVSSQISSQQSLDRRTSRASTFSGG